MGATHDSNINIQVILDAASPSQFGFTPLLVVSTSSISDRVRVFTSAADVDDDQDLTEAQKDALLTAFIQQPRPGLVKLGFREDDGESNVETYAEALTAIESADSDWYGFAIESREAVDIVAASDWAESRTKLFVAQNGVADWLTAGGVPSGFSDIENAERTAVIFHDTDLQAADMAWLANRLVFNPDTRSAPWDAEIKGVSAYASGITAGQRAFGLTNNANLMLPYGPAPAFVDAGALLSGRPIYERVTADWFKLRLEAKIALAKVNASARGEKIPLGEQGISILRPLVESQFSEGETAGHFAPGQSIVDFITPTQADIDNQRIRATARAQIAVSAREFEFTFNFQRTPVIEDSE